MYKNGPGKKANTNILLVTAFFSLLFVSMMGYLVYFVATNEQTLINNSYNSRQALLLSQNVRGSIYAADGTVLVYTSVEEDGTETREYLYGEKFAHVIGYSTYGRTGVEDQANYYLVHSNAPLNLRVVNSKANVKNPGDDVYTTLDVELQEAAFNALDGYKGAIIVTDVKTGKILAMVSMPDFDPNQIEELWPKLVENEEEGTLVNRVTQGLYPPGSTFKILTALEYIRENPDSWQNYEFLCTSYYEEQGSRINCYHGTRHGSINFEEAFSHSCNAAFAQIGMSLDEALFADTLKGLYFNQPLPVKFLYSQSSVVMGEEISANDMMQTAIGQGQTQITPLQLNMITAAIANGGTMYKPYVVDRVENCQGVVIKQFMPSSCGQVMTPEEAEALTMLMQAVVENGTGRGLSGLAYTVAGKTGSAEYSTIKGESHAWFTGFAPIEDPKICVTVIVESAGSGSDYAVPIAKRVFNAYFNK
ncbi:MAG: penicillin-binding protein 2 [Lachnospiraceae bacterium]|nr:penicillin-binding protein 2 [Lachnospiraceae bacterium]